MATTASATKIDWSTLSGTVLEGGYELKDVLDAREHAAKLNARVLGSGGRTASVYFEHLEPSDAEDQQDIWQTLRDAPHPNLNRPAAIGRREVAGFDTVYLVLMEPDERLEAVVPERPLEWEEAAEVLHSCEKGLAHLHAHGLIHGGLSPQTVEAVGYTVQLNTESVRRLGKKARVEWNKPRYLAPESKGANLTTAADVWCLGATLIEVLTQHPFGSEGAELEEGLPLAAVIQRCLDRNPATRCTLKQAPAFESGQAVATPVAAPTPKPPPPPEREALPVVEPLIPPASDLKSAYDGGASQNFRGGAARLPNPLTPKASPAKQVSKEDMALVPMGKRHKKVQKRQPVGARIRTLDGPILLGGAEESDRELTPAVGARILAVGHRPNFLRNMIAVIALVGLFFAAVRLIIIPKLQSTNAPLTSHVTTITSGDVPSGIQEAAASNAVDPNGLVAAAPNAGHRIVQQPATPDLTTLTAAPAPIPVPDFPVAKKKPEYFRVVLASYVNRPDAVHALETLAQVHPELVLKIALSKDNPEERPYMLAVGGLMNPSEAEPLQQRLISKGLKTAHLVRYQR